MGNNPNIYGDPDGRDIIMMIDKQGAGGLGHMGMLIGDEASGWYYYSHNGSGGGAFGPSVTPADGVLYESLQHFFNVGNFDNDGKKLYEKAIRFKSKEPVLSDWLMRKKASELVNSYYILGINDCRTTVVRTMREGIDFYKTIIFSRIPRIDFSHKKMFGAEVSTSRTSVEVGQIQVNGWEYAD
jgi:hypothetical protein